MPDVEDCIENLETINEEEIPKLILKFPLGATVFVYKNQFGRSWLEYTPNLNKRDEDTELLKLLGYKMEQPIEYNSDASNSNISINIIDEEEFLVRNLKYIVQPTEKFMSYLLHQKVLKIF